MASRFIKYLKEIKMNNPYFSNHAFYKMIKKECWADDIVFPNRPHNHLFSEYKYDLPKNSFKYKRIYKDFILEFAITKHNNLNILSLKEKTLKKEV